MLKKIRQNISGAIKIALVVFLAIAFLGTIVVVSLARADSASTGVTVGNTVPVVSVAPVEEIASATIGSSNGAGAGNTEGNPTNEGTAQEFAATYTDANGDQWKLLICKTAGTTGTDCDGGAGDRWCVSAGFANTAVENTCSYTTLNGDAESNAWFAYGCDAVGCSASGTEQGSGTTGSPFYVNHDPSFTVYSNDGDGDGGDTVTFATTTADTDIDAVQDVMRLYVCTTAAFTGGASPACTVSELCHDTTPSDDPSCTYSAPLPDQTINGYGYVIDTHGLVSSTGGAQGTNDNVVINNATPTLTAGNITLKDTDGAGNMILTVDEGETTDFLVTFIVTDANSCETSAAGDEITSAVAHVYLTSVTQAGCDNDAEDNNNDCYANAHSGTSGTCVQDEAVDSCTNNTDTTVGWRCEFPLQFHATPGAWQVSIIATDDDAAASTLTQSTAGNTLDSSLFYDVDNGSSSIAYGTLSPEGTSASDILTNVQATGNVAIDTNVSSDQANALCSDYATCAGYTIADSYQHHDETASTAYASMTALSTTPTRVETNIVKTTTTGSPSNANVYWKINIPAGQYATAYTGSNTIAGVAAN